MNGQRLKAEINLNNIKSNYNYLKTLTNNCRIMAVVKADAYGHGALRVCKALKEVGADFFAVACLEEGVALRDNGITDDILVLGITKPECAEQLYRHNLIQTVASFEYVQTLTKTHPIRIHIKIDTGMSRLGIYCHNFEDINNTLSVIKTILKIPNALIEGVFTHFSESDNTKSDFTQHQFDVFTKLLEESEEKQICLGLRHCCNSGGLLNFPYMKLDMVRIGIALYGLTPGSSLIDINLKSAMALKCKVVAINHLCPGDTISYNRSYIAKKEMTVATLSIGYADGFSRVLSNKAEVRINNKSVKVIGNICMDLSIVDITGIECNLFDDAVIFENSEDINRLALQKNTVNYEIICNLAARIDKIYLEG